jgi:hypothetical protein
MPIVVREAALGLYSRAQKELQQTSISDEVLAILDDIRDNFEANDSDPEQLLYNLTRFVRIANPVDFPLSSAYSAQTSFALAKQLHPQLKYDAIDAIRLPSETSVRKPVKLWTDMALARHRTQLARTLQHGIGHQAFIARLEAIGHTRHGAFVDALISILQSERPLAQKQVQAAELVKRLPRTARKSESVGKSVLEHLRTTMRATQGDAPTYPPTPYTSELYAAIYEAQSSDRYFEVRYAMKRSIADFSASLSQLISSPLGRAFESLLIKHLIAEMRQETMQAWYSFACFVDGFFDQPERQAKAGIRAYHAVQKFRQNGHRNWWAHVRYIDSLLDLEINSPSNLALVRHFLRLKPVNGYEVAARVCLIRCIDLVYYQQAPALFLHSNRKAQNFFSQTLSPRSGVIQKHQLQLSAAPVEPDFSIGVTLEGQRIITTETWIGSVRPMLFFKSDLLNPHLAERVRHGNITATGLSGTANDLVHLYAAVKDSGKVAMTRSDFFLGVCSFLVNDGGHSFSEVLWVLNNALGERFAVATKKNSHSINRESVSSLRQMLGADAGTNRAFESAYRELADHADMSESISSPVCAQ